MSQSYLWNHFVGHILLFHGFLDHDWTTLFLHPKTWSLVSECWPVGVLSAPSDATSSPTSFQTILSCQWCTLSTLPQVWPQVCSCQQFAWPKALACQQHSQPSVTPHIYSESFLHIFTSWQHIYFWLSYKLGWLPWPEGPACKSSAYKGKPK